MTDITLNDGTTLPRIGFGTYQLKGFDGTDAIRSALDIGYRLIDTAVNYENEGTVGRAVRVSGIDREELRISSKLPGRFHGHHDAILCVEESLARAGLDYFDFFLIHWPNPKRGKYVEAFEALAECRNRGLIRSLGVSNFLPEHLEAVQDALGEYPSVNQIEVHPYFPQDEQVAWHRAHGIATEAWSPLGRKSDLMANTTLQRIADTHGVSIGQVVLRWHLQREVVPLPKSQTPSRQRENFALDGFRLTESDIAAIAALAKPDGRVGGQDPETHEEF